MWKQSNNPGSLKRESQQSVRNDILAWHITRRVPLANRSTLVILTDT